MKIFSAVKILEKCVRLKCMTCEGEIISFLLENGPSRPRDIILNSKYSAVSVFSKLNDLRDMGFIVKDNSTNPKKSHYNLSNNLLDNIYGDIVDLSLSAVDTGEFVENRVSASNEIERLIISSGNK